MAFISNSLKNKFFGIIEESPIIKPNEQSEYQSQEYDVVENNLKQNIFNPQNSDKRWKDIRKQIQEVVPRNTIKEISWITANDKEFIIEASEQIAGKEKIRRKLISIIFRKCSFINSSDGEEVKSANRLVEKFFQDNNLELVFQHQKLAGEQLSKLIQTIFKEIHVSENQSKQEIINKKFNYIRHWML